MCKKCSEIVAVAFCVNQLVKKAWIISQGTLVKVDTCTPFTYENIEKTRLSTLDSKRIFQNGILIIFLKTLRKTLAETMRPSIIWPSSLPALSLNMLTHGSSDNELPSVLIAPMILEHIMYPQPQCLVSSPSPFRAQLKWSFLRSACLKQSEHSIIYHLS